MTDRTDLLGKHVAPDRTEGQTLQMVEARASKQRRCRDQQYLVQHEVDRDDGADCRRASASERGNDCNQVNCESSDKSDQSKPESPYRE